MAGIPKDPVMLVSYLNTQLRDYYSSLDELCSQLGVDRAELESTLQKAAFAYDKERNQFR